MDFRDHLFVPNNVEYINEDVFSKLKDFASKHKKKIIAGAGLLGGGYLLSRPSKPKYSATQTSYEYDPNTGKWYKIDKTYTKT